MVKISINLFTSFRGEVLNGWYLISSGTVFFYALLYQILA